jgi:predicted RNA-binding Zn-ribbon protein involved in translation (DUF1610 family)
MNAEIRLQSYEHWGACDECGFQGLLLFQSRRGEDYEDEDALGFVMDSSCPACGHEEAVLVVVEQYREMVFMSRRRTDR